MDRLIDQLCDDFEAAWQQGERPSIESIRSQEPSVDRADLLFHLLRLETGLRQADGQSSVYVAATWTRDALDWRVGIGCDEQELHDKEEQFRADGFQIVDACPYADRTNDKGSHKFAALWVAKREQVAESRLVTCLSTTEFSSKLKLMAEDGFASPTTPKH